MPCLELSEIELFVNGRLADDASRSVSTHIASCSACCELAAEVRDNLGVASRLRGVVAGESGRATASPGAPKPAVPLSEIGAYRVLREIGRGGMGVVYEAEQENPRRVVALKVLNGTYAVQPQYERLFRREAQALARLKHPHIAAIHEAGRAPDGRPFFAMELVRGRPLTQYARAENPALPRKLALFREICAAIAYAHQRGVIHRDLKPGNILVVEERIGGPGDQGKQSAVSPGPLAPLSPQPKILDFGLARIFDVEDSSAATTVTLTDMGRIQGTWPYMSPEQARGDAQNIDIRSDVYSLGIVLYELLTGQLPYAIDRTNVLEAARTICEKPPTPPGTIVPALRGDLETIVLKALEKDPARRYASAAALGDDIERYLGNQPISARPPTVTYQLRKLMARHKLSFAFAAAVFSLVVGFGAAMTFLYAEARDQRRAAEANLTRAQNAEADATQEAQRARKEARTANEARDFLVRVFKISDPGKTSGNTLTAREALDEGVVLLRGELADEPEVRATLLDTIGLVYRNLGLYAEAAPLLDEALELRRGLFGERHLAVAETLANKGNLLQVEGDFEAAEAALQASLEICRALKGPDHATIAQVLDNLGTLNMERGRYARAGPFFQEALDMRRRLYFGPHPQGEAQAEQADVAVSLGHLAWFHKEKGDRIAAEQVYREALDLQRKLLGNMHPQTAEILHNLGALYRTHGDFAQAEPCYREALAICRQLRGDEHRDVAACLSGLADVLVSKGDFVQAEELGRQALDLHRRLFGDLHPNVANSLNNLGQILSARGRPAEAEPLYREALTIFRQAYPDGHSQTAGTLNNLATLLQGQRNYSEAEGMFKEALEIHRAKSGPEHAAVAMALGNLGNLYMVRGDLAQAEPLLRESLDMGRRTLGLENGQVPAQLQNLAGVCFLRGDYAGAEPLLREAVALERKLLGESHPDLLKSLHNLARDLQAQNKLEEAEPFYRESLAIARKTLDGNHPNVAQVLGSLGAFLNARGAPAEAIPLFQEALEIRRKRFAPDSPEVAATVQQLGDTLVKAERAAEAEPFLREVLELRRRTQPAGSVPIAQAEMGLGSCLIRLQRYEEAEPLLQAAYSTLKTAAGDKHKNTQAALKRLVELYETWGKPERANEYRTLLDTPKSP